MSLQQQINNNLKEALKSGDSFRVGVLRMLNSSLHNREIEKKGKGQEPILNDDDVIEVLGREAKKRKESAEIYTKGNRSDLAEKEKKELEIIRVYLPPEVNAEEIEKIVAEVVAKSETKDIQAFGKIMGEAMKQLKGRADASLVGEMIKQKLGN